MAGQAIDREMLAQVRRIQVRTDRMVTDVMAGGYNSVFRGSGIEFDEVREFTEGDDLRSVDWNVTARTGRPHVKKFMEERELTVLFVLDVSKSLRFGSDPGPAPAPRPLAETAALFCGCIAFAAARNNDKAGLVAFSDRIETYVPGKKGRHHVLRLVREVFAPAAEGTGSDLALALDFVGRVQRKRAVVFVVSDFLLDSDYERPLRLLAQRHDVIAVRLRDPRTESLPESGLLRLRDVESGAERWVDCGSRAVRDAYARIADEDRRAFLQTCRRAGVDPLLIDLPFPARRPEGRAGRPSGEGRADLVGNAIVSFFRMRERRGGRR
ncbi:MAG: DUF58 domain-containing protein [Planctomycetota bacterium]